MDISDFTLKFKEERERRKMYEQTTEKEIHPKTMSSDIQRTAIRINHGILFKVGVRSS